jgi:hypothetical protein
MLAFNYDTNVQLIDGTEKCQYTLAVVSSSNWPGLYMTMYFMRASASLLSNVNWSQLNRITLRLPTLDMVTSLRFLQHRYLSNHLLVIILTVSIISFSVVFIALFYETKIRRSAVTEKCRVNYGRGSGNGKARADCGGLVLSLSNL